MNKEQRALHEIIQEDLLNKINSGEYKENDILPKELDLAQMYGVSRPTVRQAIKSLASDGLLESKKEKVL